MNSQRILAAGGLILFLLSAAYGLYYDLFVRQEQQVSLLYSLDMALNMAAKGDITMASAFATDFAGQSQTQYLHSRIPLHLAMTAAMTSVPLWLAGKLDVSERMKRVLSLLLILGGLVLTGGDIAEILGNITIGRYIVASGYAWLALGLAGYLVYTALFVWLNAAPPRARRR